MNVFELWTLLPTLQRRFYNLVVDEEPRPAVDDESQDATVTDLNMKRRKQSAELQAVFSQLAILCKQNEVLNTEIDIAKP